MRKNILPHYGFTLIELLLYISISSVILLALVSFLFMLLSARVKNQTIAEVEQQGAEIMQIVTQTIRNAEAIDSPTIGNSAALVSLKIVAENNDPTIFDSQNGVFRIQEGSAESLVLTNNRVMVSDLLFLNASRNDTPGVIRVQFKLTHINPENKNEYDFNKVFFGSAALRP